MERETYTKMKHKKVQKLYIHKSEISARSHQKGEIEGGPEQERESSLVSIFSPPSLQILHTLVADWAFVSKFWVFVGKCCSSLVGW